MLKKVNTYGIYMVGLKAAAKETHCLRGRYGELHCEIYYDANTGEVVASCLLRNNWTNSDSGDYIKVCDTCERMTMQEIADAVRDTLANIE